jgi:hypothetical protein
MGWHHPRIDRDRIAFSSIWRAFKRPNLNPAGWHSRQWRRSTAALEQDYSENGSESQ